MTTAAQVLPPRLAGLRRAVRFRMVLIVGLLVVPPAAAATVLAYRSAGAGVAAAFGLALLIALAMLSLRATRTYDRRWLLRQLNAALPTFEDSLELALGPAPAAAEARGLLPLQRLRIQQRLQQTQLPDLRPGYPRRGLTLAWSGALVLLLLALIDPSLWSKLATLGTGSEQHEARSAAIEGSLHFEPPAYTGLSAQTLDSLDAKVPAGSKLAFRLRTGAAVANAALLFHDGSRLDLHRDGDDWRGERVLDASSLYRVQLDQAPAAPADRLYRIDAIPDRAPEVIVHTPDKTLNLLAEGQKSWDLAFEASDDYGLGAAQLSISLAQGSGEQVKTTEQTIVLDGSGDARHRSYRKTLDLNALGFAAGDDLIVRLSVADNHPPTPNRTQSASFILRWPAEAEAVSDGMDGLVQKTLPAYFSSERQLIIDSEALQAQRDSLEQTKFASRSDDLGVEQKVLRLRYGQFLGEEFESNAEHALSGQESQKEGHEALKDVPPEHADQAPKPSGFGNEGNITSDFGHVHDKPGAATLLDPDTKRLLKSALDQMWQAELQLRQAQPDLALPYEYKALEYIKQVQQAERIYLARAGVQLPQVDAARRLTGERAGLTDRDSATPAAKPEDSPIPQVWQTLTAGGTPDWAAFSAWARQHQNKLPDALGLLAAADRLQRDPSCSTCRVELKALLWPLLPPPATALLPRTQPDAAGAAYLKALSEPAPEASP